MPRAKPNTVYFLSFGANGPIKIGCTSDLKARLSALQWGVPEPLLVLGTIDGGIAVERQFHRRFSELRMSGEWFRRSPELLRAIAESVSGVQALAELSPHARLIDAVGGSEIVSGWTKVRPYTVEQWHRDGIIPAQHHFAILTAARAAGIALEPADFFGEGRLVGPARSEAA